MNQSSAYIKEYLAKTSQSIRMSLDMARDNNSVLASLVASALTRGIKIPSPVRSKRASLVYYDRFIKPENMAKSVKNTPRRRPRLRERSGEKFEAQTLDFSATRDKSSELPRLNMSYVPVIFPREDRRRPPLFNRHLAALIKRKKNLKREHSETSLISCMQF